MRMIEIYNSIKEQNIINNVYSKYWIYDVDDTIVQQNGMSARKITIRMFDRNYKNNEVVNEITLVLDGSQVSVKNLKKISGQGILEITCELLVDLNVNFQSIYISGYKLNNQKINLSSDYYIQGLVYEGDEGKLNVCKKLLGQDQFEIVPEYSNMFWFCKCGCANLIENETCPHCGASKTEMMSLADLDKKSLIIKHLPSKFKLDTKTSVKEQVSTFIRKFSTIFSVDQQVIASLFNMNELQLQQDQMIEEEITNYLKNYKIQWNHDYDFNENIDIYTSKITNDMISTEQVCSYMNLHELQDEYYADKKQFEIDEINRKRSSFFKKIGIGVAGILVICLIAGALIIQQINIKNNSAKGITIKDTVENRAKEFKTINFDDTITQENYFDNLEVNELNAPSNFVKYCKDKSIDSLEELLDDNKIIASTKYLTNKPKEIKIQTIKNKQFRPLTEDVFLIAETVNIEEGKDKIYIYLGDATGKILYDGDKEYSYLIRKYDGEKILEDEYYVDGIHTALYTYEYTKDDSLSEIVFSYSYESEDGSITWTPYSTYFFESGKLVKKNVKDTGTSDWSYEYKDNKICRSVSTRDDASEIYVYDYLNEFATKFSTQREGYHYNVKYYFSAGGVKSAGISKSYTYSKLDSNTIIRYFYNFEYGLVYTAIFNMNKDGDYIVSNISVLDISKGIVVPHYVEDINLDTIISFDSFYVGDENSKYLNIYYAESYYDLSDSDSIEDSSKFLFPSDTQRIYNIDLAGKSKDEVALIRNEIFARHGYEFQTEPFKSYFNKKDWYVVNKNYSEDLLNEIEKENSEFILEYETKKGWRKKEKD